MIQGDSGKSSKAIDKRTHCVALLYMKQSEPLFQEGVTLELMTSKEAMSFLRCSKSFLYQATRAGRIPALKLGRSWRYSRSTLEAWVTEQIQSRGGN